MTLYHAPTFEATVDEIDTLKQLEMGEAMSVRHVLKEHVSNRLLERGLVTRGVGGDLLITAMGRQLIRRQDN